MKAALTTMGKGLQTGNIYSVCQGHRSVAYGFSWRWRPHDDDEAETAMETAPPAFDRKRKQRDGDEGEVPELPAPKPRSGKRRSGDS